MTRFFYNTGTKKYIKNNINTTKVINVVSNLGLLYFPNLYLIKF